MVNLCNMRIGQVAEFDNVAAAVDDEETMRVERRATSFYGDCGKYDFECATADEATAKLIRWGYTIGLT